MMQITQMNKGGNISILEICSLKKSVCKEKSLNETFSKFKELWFIFKQAFNLDNQTEVDFVKKENKSFVIEETVCHPEAIQIEISSNKINALLERRQICAADIQCLNTESKQCFQKLCLKTCLYHTVFSKPDNQLLDNLILTESQVSTDNYE